MKNIRVLSVVLLSVGLSTFAAAQDHDHGFCGATEARKKLIEQYPEILANEEALERSTREYVEANKGQRSSQVYIIPVVFHIVHQYGSENISDQKIYEAIETLNRDFRKLNPDTASIVPEFDTIAADARIEFRLATIDPLGNCTNGIDRIASVQTYIGSDEAKLNPWPRNKYLNIWVVADMRPGVGGYAYYPSAVAGGFMSFRDGIVVRYGTVGNSSGGAPQRTITHEVGHYLNLAHTWGSTNDPGIACGDDGVSDTPITKGWSVCNLSGAECDTSIVENVQNYMEYAFCSNMFTAGQVARMHATLNDPTASRNNLWTPANLAATGTDGITDLVCAPKADFYPNRKMVCVGNNVIFHDNTQHGAATTWSWTFQDGTPATSTVRQPTVSFSSPGWKTVTLTVTNDQGTDTYTNTRTILISETTAQYQWPIYEGFESASVFNGFWTVNNPDNNGSVFTRSTEAAYSGNASVKLSSFNAGLNPLVAGDNDKDELITPSIDLSGISPGMVVFRYAYATQALTPADITEKLEIFNSTDCGVTWLLRKTISGTALTTASHAADPYTPASRSEWGKAGFNLLPTVIGPSVRFKFVYTSGIYSNNLWIDDINIVSGVVDVEEVEPTPEIEVFPNPFADYTRLRLQLVETAPLVITLIDASGRLVREVYSGQAQAGEHNIDIQGAGLDKGFYFLRIQTGNASFVRTLVHQ